MLFITQPSQIPNRPSQSDRADMLWSSRPLPCSVISILGSCHHPPSNHQWRNFRITMSRVTVASTSTPPLCTLHHRCNQSGAATTEPLATAWNIPHPTWAATMKSCLCRCIRFHCAHDPNSKQSGPPPSQMNLQFQPAVPQPLISSSGAATSDFNRLSHADQLPHAWIRLPAAISCPRRLVPNQLQPAMRTENSQQDRCLCVYNDNNLNLQLQYLQYLSCNFIRRSLVHMCLKLQRFHHAVGILIIDQQL
jgi:hypothetical protein